MATSTHVVGQLERRARSAICLLVALCETRFATEVHAQRRDELSLTQRLVITGRDHMALQGRPSRVVADSAGRLFVLHGQSHASLPIVFNSTGDLIGTVGTRGRGPGEMTVPLWIDAALDDSIRVFERGRTLVFTSNLKHARTVADGHPQVPQCLAVLRSGVHVLQSAEISDLVSIPSKPSPLLVRTDSGQLLRAIEIPLLDGGLTRTRFARDRTNSDRVWLLEYQERVRRGYRVVNVDLLGNRRLWFNRAPIWWQNGDRNRNPARPVSFIADVRHISSGRLVVLIATPREDWQSFRVDPKTLVGYWKQFDSVIEVLDVQQRRLVATSRARGYPISVVADNDIATYSEDEEGYPRISIWRFENRR